MPIKPIHNLICLIALLCYFNLNSQNCPSRLGNNTSVYRIHFKINPGSCNAYSNTIEVDGKIYNKSTCHGSNLYYNLAPSQTPISSATTFLANFQTRLCQYVNRNLTSGTLSIDENDALSFNLFPAGEKRFKLSLKNREKVSIEIIDLSGRIAKALTSQDEQNIVLNLDALSSGLYIVRVISETSSGVKRILL